MIDEFRSYRDTGKFPLDPPPKGLSSMPKWRGWLNKEWAAVTLPMNAFTTIDGLIKYMGTGQDLYGYQSVVAGFLTVWSALERPSETFRQGTLSIALAVAGAGAGFYNGLPVFNEGIRQFNAHLQSLPQITPETLVPASVLCNKTNSNGNPHEVIVDGKSLALTCPKPK